MNTALRSSVRLGPIAAALFVLTAFAACAHRYKPPPAESAVWEIENTSPCAARVAVRAYGRSLQGLGSLPAGAKQRYFVSIPDGGAITATPVEADGATACKGIFPPSSWVKVRKL